MRRKTQRLVDKPKKYALDAERAIKYFNDLHDAEIKQGVMMPLSKRSFDKPLNVTPDTFSRYDNKESKILTALIYIHEKTGCPIEKLIKEI